MTLFRWFASAVILSAAFAGLSVADEPGMVPSPLSPEDSLKHIAVAPGWKVELVAAEPLIVDPVAFDWGDDGRLWVVEMRDYPLGLDGKPGSRVKALEDTDHDGRYDKATVLVDDLSYCNGICAWHKGVIVTAAPAIIYLEDTNGDGRADIRKPLYTGFTEGNPQLRINGLRWGIDGWIYCGNGIQSAGKIKSEATGETIDIGGRDLRIQPDTGKLEALTGPSQFGREHDDFGHWFGCQNAKPLIHYLMEDADLRRNPAVVPPDVRLHVPVLPAPGAIFPRSRPGKFHHVSQLGHFTSCCGIALYRESLAGEAYQNNAFICEPANNLVHREILKQAGATFSSRRADDELTSEWLASDDTWFRPVMARLGPDGAIYIADMYREIIDHPQYIPKEQQVGLNFRTGDDRGRIYRVVPVNKRLHLVPRLDTMAPVDLARLLESPNGTMRDRVQRRIVSEKLRTTDAMLLQLTTTNTPAATRVAALWTLALLDRLPQNKSELFEMMLEDGDPRVRREAVRVARREGAKNLHAVAETRLKRLAADDDSDTKIQVALALGDFPLDGPGRITSGRILRDILLANCDDSWIVAAAVSSLGDRPRIESFFHDEAHNFGPGTWPRFVPVARPLFQTILANRDKAKEPGIPERLLEIATAIIENEKIDDMYRRAILAALFETLPRYGLSVDGAMVAPGGQKLATTTTRLRTQARELLTESPQGRDQVTCLQVLGWIAAEHEKDRAIAGTLLKPQSPTSVQLAALAVLARIGGPELPDTLLAGWSAHSPALRAEILNLLLSREPLTKSLLDAIESGKLPAADVDAARRQRLLTHGNSEIKAKATKLLAASMASSRAEALEAFQPVLKMTGVSSRGQEIFNKRCTSCHLLGGKGAPVGPDLLGLTDRSYPSLLVALLDPNRNVEARWVNYIVVTRDGRTFAGLLADETGASITLVDAEGRKQSLLRSEIEELKSTGKSLMPEGLEKDLKPQDVADLLEFVRRGGLK